MVNEVCSTLQKSTARSAGKFWRGVHGVRSTGNLVWLRANTRPPDRSCNKKLEVPPAFWTDNYHSVFACMLARLYTDAGPQQRERAVMVRGRKPADQPTVFASIAVRLDPALREDTKRQAEQAGLSLNRYVAAALAEYNKRQAKKAARDQLELVDG